MRCTWLLTLSACGRIDFDPAVSRFDARTSDAPFDAPTKLGPLGPFSGNLYESQLTTSGREYGPTISSDGLELYYSTFRMPSVGFSDLWRATRSGPGSTFGVPQAIPMLNTTADDADASLSQDGLTLYIGQSFGLIVSTRSSAIALDWSPPVSLTSSGNLGGLYAVDFGPADLRLVAFSSFSGDLYESTRPDAASDWGVPQILAGLSDSTSGAPSLTSDGLEIFWESDVQPPKAIWHATRPTVDAPFGTPEKLSLGVNVDGFQCGDPDISGDGRTLVFVSTAAGTGEYDVWTAERPLL